jgi:UDP-N-acetylglucosamine 4-epimerase
MALYLVTGGAGFIGSSIARALIKRGDQARIIDNFSSGRRENFADFAREVELIEADILDPSALRRALQGVDVVYHQAAIPSVPKSMAEPIENHEANASGTLRVLHAAREAGVRRLVYAASSAAYGDAPELPKIETQPPAPISPYGASKLAGEYYLQVYAQAFGLETVSLRYFNVFGPRQDPNGAYAAVIPRWILAMMRNDSVFINGDGETGRDFCYIDNVVQANLLAATAEDPAAVNQVYNIALNDKTSLNQLYEILRGLLKRRYPHLREAQPVYRDFRQGDVRFSQADIGKAKKLLGYRPTWRVRQGLARTVEWYAARETHIATARSRAPGRRTVATPALAGAV